MKKIFLPLGVLSFLSVFLISCSTEATPATDDSTLIIEPDTLVLVQADSTKVLDLVLSCGCGFTVAVTGVAGDTNAISYEPIGPLDEKLTKHAIRFMYSPTSAPGQHSIKLDFLATKKTYTYTNSVVVETR